MIEVGAEGTRYLYLSAGEPLPGEGELGRRIANPPSFVELERVASPDTRVVLVESPLLDRPYWVYYLYWDNGQDLAELDSRVSSGAHTDADFENGVKTLYQRTFCATCRAGWHTLVVPPGDPYLGNPHLLPQKLRRSRVLGCPRCGHSLRQLVVKILGAAE